MTNTIATPVAEQTFRAGVNESGMFKAIQHIFSSSFSVLAEMMQNSRRAGATFVDFVFDPEAKSLTVTDDGEGIVDFSKLVRMCESGWDDNVTLADNPFGMGFFAAFFAADQLTIKSNGASFTLTLDDIQSKREFKSSPDPTAPIRGTSITLHGLNSKLMASHNYGNVVYETQSKIEQYARGFSIDVRFNGESLPRPHAQAGLKGKLTPLGFFSCGHIHDNRGPDCLQISTKNTYSNPIALYLQGLPIQLANSVAASVVIHLETQVFTPVVPDRNYLFDAPQKLALIDRELVQIGRDFLAEQKAKLFPREFVSKYWSSCKRYGVSALLNDLPVIPSALLQTIDTITEASGEMWSNVLRTDDLVSLQEIKDGSLQVWANAPDNVRYVAGNGALLKIMQRRDIASFDDSEFHADHWIRKYATDCTDLHCTIEHDGVIKEFQGYFADSEVLIQYVNSLKVTVTSATDPTFKLVEVIEKDWVMDAWLSDDETDGETSSENVICYVMPEDASLDCPLDALSDWMFDNIFDEEQKSAEVSRWDTIIASMQGASLCGAIQSQIYDMSITVTEDMVGQAMLLVAVQDSESSPNSRRLRSIDLEVGEKWEAFLKASQDAEMTADKLKQDFLRIFTSV